MALNSSWKLPLTLLLPLLCLPFLQAQSSGYLTVGQTSTVSGKRNASVEARIPVSVQPGFHVNGDKPSEEYLIPLKLTWTATGALQPGAIIYPKATQEKYEFAEKPLLVLTGNFDIVASFKVAGNASAGPGSAAGKLTYQACNNRACFQPKTVDVKVNYRIQ